MVGLSTMNSARWKRWLALAGSALLVAQCGTYWWLAELQMPLAGLRTVGGAGCQGGFVAFDQGMWQSLSFQQRQMLTTYFECRVQHIYQSAEAIPDTSVHFRPLTEHDRDSYVALAKRTDLPREIVEGYRHNLERGAKPVGYKDGCLLGWKCQGAGLFWMRSNSFHYRSELGAGGCEDLYIWLLGRWWRVWNFRCVVA